MILKRFFDISASSVAVLVSMPVLMAIALLVWIKLGTPIFFTQVRPGKNGRPFRIYKFRTMLEAGELDGMPLSDDIRLTSFGRFLRSTSLDELPELLNVLKGDMSIVGPRPLLIEYLPLYTPEQRRRHEVRPGITGWAQINGRNAISWEEKFVLDIWYVDNRSLLLDLKIIGLTCLRVIRREGINEDGQATVGKFKGTRQSSQAPS